MTDRRTPVLIVGGGPVGLALAAELGWRGVRCTLVEQTDGAIATPKMNEVNMRTMEFCRRWGIARQVRDCPFPADHTMDVAFVTRLGGRELGRLRRPPKREQRPGPASPESFQICSQLWFDPMLRALADGFPSVTLLHRCRLDNFSQDADGIAATLTHLETDARETVRADYLVACDGANSAIREACGIGLEGPGVLGRPLHMFLRHPDLAGAVGADPAAFFLLVDGDGAWANARIIDPTDGLWRLMVLDTPEDLDREAIDPDAFLARAVARPVDVEWVGRSVWTRRGLVAGRYRAGRVFLAGDSAHQVSPTGALGMNTGIGDAVGLGWALAAVLEGWGGDGLLDAYDAERRAVGRRNVDMTTGFHLEHEGFSAPAELEADTPEAAARARALGEALVGQIGAMFRTEGLQLGYRYDDSPVCVPDGTPAPPDEPEFCRQTARPGARAPHAWLADGRSTLDLFGRGFTLLRFGPDAPETDALERAAAARGVPLATVAVNDREIAALYERRLVLVRPDGHVAWRGDTPPADPLALVDRVRGAESTPATA